MGIFSGLFKKKESTVINNVVQQSSTSSEIVEQNNGTVGEAVAPIEFTEAPAPIVTDPSNVLEQMQNNFVIESEREEQEKSDAEKDPMSVFNQNITLDSNDPMSIFGSNSEGDNNQ